MKQSLTKSDFTNKLAQVILQMDDLAKFLHSLAKMLVEIFSLDWASLSLLDESGRYKLKASAQRDQAMPEDKQQAFGEQQPAWLRERQKILSQRLLEEFGPQMTPELVEELHRADTSASIPLFAGEAVIGVLNLGSPAQAQPLDKEELELLSEFAQLIGSCLSQAVAFHDLQEQRKHQRNIIDNLVSAIVAVDSENKITIFNRAAARILRLNPDQALGKEVQLLQPNLANLLLDTLHKGNSYRREELYIQPENTLIGVSTSQFYDSQGKLLGACMVFSSLSEVRKQEVAKRRQNLDTYWSNVANSLAHEVKNSIMAAKVYTEMFPKKYDDAEFRWNLYSALKRDMGKLDEFSEKVLYFAQLHDLIKQPCQIDKVMDVALNLAFQSKDAAGISLEKRYAGNIRSFPADYHQLKEAFVQLISNAVEAMSEQGKLTVSIVQESGPEMLIYDFPDAIKELPAGEVTVIKITDTGSGVPSEDLPYLFDPFFTTKEGRTGLGLSTVRKVVEKHQGVIKAESHPGEGTTFWICLPA